MNPPKSEEGLCWNCGAVGCKCAHFGWYMGYIHAADACERRAAFVKKKTEPDPSYAADELLQMARWLRESAL